MVEKRIDSVKKEIRSVLISSKDGLSLEDFCKTYKSLIGTRLPTREFGFTSDIEFLHSLSDVVHVQVEKNGYYQLYGIADQSTEHIQKLVSKQRHSKVNPKKNSSNYSKVTKSYQNFEPIVTQKCRPFVPALLRSEIVEIVKQYPEGLGYLSLIQAYQTFYKKEINLEWLSSDTAERFQKLVNAVPELDLKLTHNQLKIYYKNFYNEEEDKSSSSSYCTPQLSKAKVSPKFKSIEIERKQKISEASSIPKDVKSNFVKVLKQYPKGVLAVHFPILYEKLTKLPLDLHELGFSSLIELTDALPDIFARKNVPESSKDWILLHVDFCSATSSDFKSRTPAKFSSSYCLKGKLPSDIAQPTLPYIQGELPDVATEKFIPVFVSSVINPSLFWIQLQTEEAKSNLAKLEKDMRYFYNDNGNHYKMADADMLIGSSCVVFSTSDFHWYRALITSLPSIDCAIVSLVDYGSMEKMRRTNLYYLKYTFINMPAHAHRSTLASIKPANQVLKWNTKAQTRFVELCNQLSLLAKVDSLDDAVLSLLLCDTSGDESIYINDVLVDEGYAEYCMPDSLNLEHSRDAGNPCLENGVEFSLVGNSLKQTFCGKKSVMCKMGPSNGFHAYNGSKKHNFLPRRPFIKEEASKLSSQRRRYVKKVVLGDGYKIHIINVADEAYVSGGDLCNLFWTDKEADLLALRLQFKGAIIPTISIRQTDFEELFFQCKRYSLKDFHDSGKENSVVLYPLKCVMKILNMFGHPSLSVRETICKEIKEFSAHDIFWNEFQEPEGDDIVPPTKNTLDKLCLYDLKAMHEGLRFKKLKLIKDSQVNKTNLSITEINKIESMQNNIQKQMNAINSLCSQYTC